MVNYTTAQKVSDFTKGQLVVGDIESEWLDWVDDYINRFTGLNFNNAIAFDKKLDGNGQDWIFVPRHPLLSVTLLKIGDTTVDSADYKFYSTGRISLENKYFTEGLQNIQVTGTYGFATVPKIVEEIATRLVAAIGFEAQEGSDIESERIGDYSVKYFSLSEEDIKNKLLVLGKRNSFEGV